MNTFRLVYGAMMEAALAAPPIPHVVGGTPVSPIYGVVLAGSLLAAILGMIMLSPPSKTRTAKLGCFGTMILVWVVGGFAILVVFDSVTGRNNFNARWPVVLLSFFMLALVVGLLVKLNQRRSARVALPKLPNVERRASMKMAVVFIGGVVVALAMPLVLPFLDVPLPLKLFLFFLPIIALFFGVIYISNTASKNVLPSRERIATADLIGPGSAAPVQSVDEKIAPAEERYAWPTISSNRFKVVRQLQEIA